MKVYRENGVILSYRELMTLLKALNALRIRLAQTGTALTTAQEVTYQEAVRILTLDERTKNEKKE